jgi:hypothetical protein
MDASTLPGDRALMSADPYIQLSPTQRRALWEEVARISGLEPAILEKDYWVTWTLARLFALPEFHGHLTFKGGTSLSKVYHIIGRFSEDVDVSFHREFLGFSEERDPEKATGKERRRRLDALQQACSEVIHNKLIPAFAAVTRNEMGPTGWSLKQDEEDPQTLLFAYPSTQDGSGYMKPVIRIEMGARSDHWPHENRTLRCLVEDHMPQLAGKLVMASVQVLAAERTFWEKATLLHAEFHRESSKPIPVRYARHYYDLAQLGHSPFAKKALKDVELRKRVVTHKSAYFASARANYALATPGTFKLVPSEPRLRELELDYDAMRVMMFGEVPPFKEILNTLRELEREINSLAQ